MSFREFDLPKGQRDFGLKIDMTRPLFSGVAPVAISEDLSRFWRIILPLGMSLVTEKARAEFVTAPLLGEVWHRSSRQIAVLSGVDWNVDDSVGLNGVAGFFLCRSSIMLYVTNPVFVAIEAKRDSIPDGLGQCAAEMVAAQRFNLTAGTPLDPVYGCVTTGANWKFLRINGQQLDIDIDEYSISPPDRILGVLLHCCGVSVETLDREVSR
jgi:hypothetical protein